MSGLFELVKSYMCWTLVAATALQFVGTAILAAFSFWGIKIAENKDAYLVGIQKVEMSNKWLRAAQLGLITLLLGIGLSGLASIAGIS